MNWYAWDVAYVAWFAGFFRLPYFHSYKKGAYMTIVENNEIPAPLTVSVSALDLFKLQRSISGVCGVLFSTTSHIYELIAIAIYTHIRFIYEKHRKHRKCCALPEKGSFLSSHGEGNANLEIPLEADPATYATCDPCNAAQPRHWILSSSATRRAYHVRGGAGSIKFLYCIDCFIFYWYKVITLRASLSSHKATSMLRAWFRSLVSWSMKRERLAIWRASGQHAFRKQLPVLAFCFALALWEATWLN